MSYVVDEVYRIGCLVEVCAFIQLLMFCCPPVAFQVGLAHSGAAPSVPLRDMSRYALLLYQPLAWMSLKGLVQYFHAFTPLVSTARLDEA